MLKQEPLGNGVRKMGTRHEFGGTWSGPIERMAHSDDSSACRTLKERNDDGVENGVMLRGAVRW